MVVWRLDRAVHDPLSGEGSRQASGRWNPEGVPMVYTSAHASLAVLEKLVHVDPDLLPEDLLLSEINIPEDLPVEVAPGPMPGDWRQLPPAAETQAIGASWANDTTRAAVLSVPSAILPVERNLLLNPRHPHASQWRVISQVPFSFDDRLVAPRGG